ncbi:3'-5' exonuclease [Salinimonas lutimaris]|uniref:3'-5' exonuclease n=1 Tax=Salinimonas lutimaris TaxID=914153 RepID=UPI0010C13D1B|nr:3'-5' exonuclease [Salinimonas lutimaris]
MFLASLWHKLTDRALKADLLPEQWREANLRQLPLLSLDFELTGLDLKQAQVTSAGWITGQGATMHMSGCFYHIVKVSRDLAQSPVIHGLTEPQLVDGWPVQRVLKHLQPLLHTHVLVAHGAVIEMGMLDKLWAKFELPETDVVIIDTLQMARHLIKRRGALVGNNDLTLTQCLVRAGLPAISAHNALDDAMAAYQLWLSQLNQLKCGKNVRFDDVLHTRAVIFKKIGKKQN